MCILKYLEWLLDKEPLTNIRNYLSEIELFIKSIEKTIMELFTLVLKVGFKKNQEILAVLFGLQADLEKFIGNAQKEIKYNLKAGINR